MFFENAAPKGQSVVNKVTWQKAGRVTEPGRYMFRYGWLTITADDLAIWRQFPEASFTLVTLHGPWGWGLFAFTWGLALIGVGFKIFTIERDGRLMTQVLRY